jgi:7-keto-8-aminopelargonate synthetase-like enzyme
LQTLAAKEYSWNEKPIHGVMFDCHMSCHLVVIDDIYEALNKDTLNTRDRAGDSKSLGKRLALLHHEDAGLLFISCFVANASMLFRLTKILLNSKVVISSVTLDITHL